MGIILLVGACTASRQAEALSLQNGQRDRAEWVALLLKISNPVADHLSEGTLRRSMPVETAPGYYMDARQFTYLEAVGRTVSGVAPWLRLPDDDSKEGLSRKLFREKLLRGLTNAVDPSADDYLNFKNGQQPLVDAAFLAHGFLRAYDALWMGLNETTRQRYIDEFLSLRNRQAGNNNWLLFSGLTECFLLEAGIQPDTARIQKALRAFQNWYVGDGWYSDGERFAMDYYNSFVIHPMLVDMLQVLVKHTMASPQDYELAVKRMKRFAELQERMIASDGSFPPVGRSLPYRSGAFQALSQTALMDSLPAGLSRGQVRSALTAMMRRVFDAPATFDKQCWLTLGLAGHQPSIADPYTSTGSLYLCTEGFVALGLPADHLFWTASPAAWTSVKVWRGEQVEKDHKIE